MMSKCSVIQFRPANPTPLEKAIFAAGDAWFLSDRAKDQADQSAKAQKKYLEERDEHRKECGRQLALAKTLHAEAKINVPWKEWAPDQTGWSYMMITRRMKDFAEPDAPKERRARNAADDAKRKPRVTGNEKPVPLPKPADTAWRETVSLAEIGAGFAAAMGKEPAADPGKDIKLGLGLLTTDKQKAIVDEIIAAEAEA